MRAETATEVERRSLAFKPTMMNRLEGIIQDSDESAFTVVAAAKEYKDLVHDGIAPQNLPKAIENDTPNLSAGSATAMARIMPLPAGQRPSGS